MKEIGRLYLQVLDLLPGRARRALVAYAITLGLLSLLDGLALALLAAVIAPVVSGTSKPRLPVLGEVTDAGLAIAIGVVCLLILSKGVLALLLLRTTTRRFAQYELELGSRLFAGYLAAPWTVRLTRNSADLVRLTDGSVSTTISGFILPGSTLLGEVLNFSILLVVLGIAQPLVAAITLVYLGLLGALLFFWITKRSRQAGQVALRYSLRSSRLITEMIGALKEVTLRNKTAEVAAVVRSNRMHSTRARANTQFLAQVPRYVLESGIVGGFVLVGISGFLVGRVPGLVAAVALFGLAGFRMAPSIVRFQNVISQLNVSAPHARAVLDEIRRSEESAPLPPPDAERSLPSAPARIYFRDVSFRYTSETPYALTGVNLEIPFGSTVAFVGASGAGKSTMVDLVLGLLQPTAGKIDVDGILLSDLTTAWRSRVAYVPQEVSLFDSTVARNVALSWSGAVDEQRVRDALRRAQLLDALESRAGGIHARIGERGLALSGGQRQRLGIARALYADPLVLVMDEATSALDTATEAAVGEAISQLRGSLTIITVAHRLATVMKSDSIFFLSGGRLVAQGDFATLVAEVPEFAAQASLAGLADGS